MTQEYFTYISPIWTNKNEVHCYLIFVKLTVLEGCFALRLEGHDDEADEDVHHEEGDDDDVDEVEKRDIGTIVVNWTMVDFVGVDGHVEDARPALEGHGDEEREHRLCHVVEVERILLPDSVVHCEGALRTFLRHKINIVALCLSL